jgi:signal transduction histidine kinase
VAGANDSDGVTVRCRVPDDLPALWLDRDKLEQVLLNLLTNAVKFTDSGAVTLRACAREGAVRVEVEDTGAGIPRNELFAVFDKFHQVRRQDMLQTKTPGTGLGLPICRQIVEHYRGVIWVEPGDGGRGSIFCMELPVRE